jgi:hypothetical protein
MRLYIPENKFLNLTGSSNDLHGRNLGHVMLSNMLQGLIAGTCQPAHYLPKPCAVGMSGFPSLAMHVEIIIKESPLWSFLHPSPSH